jgi:hypothetical protein
MVRKVGMAVAQKLLLHSDARLTNRAFGHLDVEDASEVLGKAFSGTR